MSKKFLNGFSKDNQRCVTVKSECIQRFVAVVRTATAIVIRMNNPPTDDDVYMSIAFNKIDRAKADRIIRAVTAVAGLTSYSVYINDDPIEDDDDE
jgi:hypothetical protein